ncbi:uncharacterized protein LOC129595068 [Paramacrobiotus metropolitanus]|uniref:uncharacterized protein LOC129595068 n=1 Tax=Paramacrobiotus metropolitanus TaxID=2943436 RepID=UPI0024457DD8|nr:uncharacterized protein LOC129595068 [Paramacrobiotus metropolitanus]XP_055347953.1 uncharacterized protein LOC129595068 [Paramacrobiotus metropolitanus]
MLDNRKRLINTFPVPIRSQLAITDTCESLYSFIADNYTFSRVEYYLDYEDDTYNVLVVGPTGAGKSHLINVFFNQNICESDVSHRSVTKEIVFVRGRGKVYNPEKEIYQERSIVVADTIGLCDTEWEDTKVINLIRNRVSSNLKHIDAVYVVFRADRLLKEHVANIQHILKWLGYQTGLNCLRFLFVGTYADYISTEKKDALRAEATTMFQLKDTSRKIAPTGHSIQSLVYTRFPPEDSLNEMTKEKTQQCWRELRVLLNHPGVCDRIPLDQGSSCAIL